MFSRLCFPFQFLSQALQQLRSTAKHLSSRISSILPHWNAEGLSGICSAPSVSSMLSRGTWQTQQHTVLTSPPWCHHHVACCSAPWLNPAFSGVFPSSIELHHILPWTQPGSTGAAVPWGHVGGQGQLFWDLLPPVSSKPSPLAMRHHHCNPSSVGHDKHRFTAHLSQIQSNSVSEVSHPVTWRLTTKATCKTFVVNFSLSSKWGVGYHAKGICVWCNVWVDDRPKKKKTTALPFWCAILKIHFNGTAVV